MKNPIAFFCMEYALDTDPRAYAGGLGVLAGDYLLEAAEESFPVVALGLRYGLSAENLASLATLDIVIAGETVHVKAWERIIGTRVRLILFDTDITDNSPSARTISAKLYDPDFYNRIKQQMLLGICGLRLLKQLGIKPRVYHLNEGHTAFASLALLAEGEDYVAPIAATKHTIFSDAGIFISKSDFERYVTPYCIEHGLVPDTVWKLGQYEGDPDKFSTTKFLLSRADIANGVSALHTVYEKQAHPHSHLIPITNGVNITRWQAEELSAGAMPDEELIAAKSVMRRKLLAFVKETTGQALDPDVCTVVWARRFAAYKRPSLLFSDLERLKKIVAKSDRPLQFIISGKAHASDAQGQETVRTIVAISETPEFKGKIVYVPDYSIAISHYLVQGADIWLNTPERGKEACGTSGIKASLNGALQCSVSDGWVDEEEWSGKGFILDAQNTAESLYARLEHDIPQAFYDKPLLVRMMRETMIMAQSRYSAQRMLKDYEDKIYSIRP